MRKSKQNFLKRLKFGFLCYDLQFYSTCYVLPIFTEKLPERIKLKLMDRKWKNIVSSNIYCSLETESRPLKLHEHVVWSVVLKIFKDIQYVYLGQNFYPDVPMICCKDFVSVYTNIFL